MATANPFDLLGDDDNDDPSLLVQKIVSAPVKKDQTAGKTTAAQPAKPAAKLPSKPLPPAQAVREARTEAVRGGRGGGRGYGRGRGGGGGFNRDSGSNENSFGNRGFSGDRGVTEESDGGKTYERYSGGGGGGGGGYGGPRGGFRGGRRGGFTNGDAEDGDRPRRPYERRSGTGRGNEFKREGSGRGNWGSHADEITQETEEVVNEGEKTVVSDKPLTEEESKEEKKENVANESEEKEAEDKEMTLEEYQKVIEEKRKALEALKTEERKVEVDKELASMQQLSNKKSNDDIFVKLGTDKDRRKEIAEKEERAKKSLSINEFLKPAAGERSYTSGGRGRGRGGPRGGGGGGRYNQVFNYGGSHGVDVVSKSDYDNCATSNAINSYSDGATVISLTQSGPMYFVCPSFGHCNTGMKLAINVVSQASNSPTTTVPSGGSNSSPPATTTQSSKPTKDGGSTNSANTVMVVGFSLMLTPLFVFLC
ncbi:hypothetical protein E3N88_44813 [Mikania micrantha]|uniref:Phytocyanin domain-containing protein n=1 Tax=Mikania micrantha TaxID=192012 RepID=A0A5N6LAX7_9ASTR|nr:hypothetical protein E3N88_44813 [Mikania micrantha]